jgi:hypothetical protein
MKAALAVVCVLACVSAAVALSEPDYQFLFTRWVEEHGKVIIFFAVHCLPQNIYPICPLFQCRCRSTGN